MLLELTLSCKSICAPFSSNIFNNSILLKFAASWRAVLPCYVENGKLSDTTWMGCGTPHNINAPWDGLWYFQRIKQYNLLIMVFKTYYDFVANTKMTDLDVLSGSALYSCV